MTQHWLSEKGLKAIQIMGWPEWETGAGMKSCLCCVTANGKPAIGLRTECEMFQSQEPTSPHVALCLLQHQAIKRLSALGTPHLNLYEDESCSIWIEIEEDNMAVPLYDGGGENIDEALINALLSTEKK